MKISYNNMNTGIIIPQSEYKIEFDEMGADIKFMFTNNTDDCIVYNVKSITFNVLEGSSADDAMLHIFIQCGDYYPCWISQENCTSIDITKSIKEISKGELIEFTNQ